MPASADRSVPFDASRPHVARVYDYLLGGKDNFAADRALGDKIIASVPAVQLGVRAQRDVLGRVVRYLVGEVGLRQLLDIGSGLPTADNVHEIAQRIDPATRVVYLDNDPIVLSHAQALLADEKATLYDALPSGSYVFIHHLLATEDPAADILQERMRSGLGRAQFRTMDQVRDLFGGLELVEPGLVLVPDWRPEPPTIRDHPVLEMACAGVARKP
jgi:S-adenosyl methyltransferase